MTTDTEKLAADIKRVMELDARHKKERSKWYAESHLCLQADIIRRQQEVIRVQHETLIEGKHYTTLAEHYQDKSNFRELADKALALSAPLVKEEV